MFKGIKAETKLYLLVLSLASVFFGILPLLIKPTNPFYIIDPGPTYLANALEFIQTRRIFMIDHPGTPLVVFLSFVILPIKFVIKLLGFPNFTLWALGNFTGLYWVSIISVWFVFIVSVFVLHLGVYRLFRSVLVNTFLFLILFLNPMFLRMQRIVTPEVFGFFFLSLWFFFVVEYLKKKKIDYLLISSLFAGLAVASKLTFLFTPAVNLIYSFTKNKKEKMRLVIMSITAGFSGFLLGTVAIYEKYPKFLGWFGNLLIRTGRSGQEDFGFVNLANIDFGFRTWFGQNPLIFLLIVVSVFLVLKRAKGSKFWLALFSAGLIGILAFSKYREAHYQAGNFILICIFLTYLFSMLSNKLKAVVLTLLLLFVVRELQWDFNNERGEIIQAAKVQDYVNKLPENSIIIWELGTTKEYAMIRGRDWSDAFYAEELEQVLPKNWQLYYLDYDLIMDSYGRLVDISGFCWDGMVMREDILSEFENYRDNKNKYTYEQISGTKMYFVRQKECKE